MVSETKMVFKKPVQALVMIPKVGKLTVIARKLYNVLLHSALREIAEYRISGEEIPPAHLFSARLRDLLEPIEVGSSNLTSSAKVYLAEMVSTMVEWDCPEAKKGSTWGVTNLLSDAFIKPETGVDVNNAPRIVEWAYPATILKTLLNPELYAQLNIIQIAKLTSYEALVLYEICTRYRTNFDGLTNKNEPQWWVRALSNKRQEVDPETKVAQLRPWTKFKEEKINTAISEINGKTDLNIELIEDRKGRKITAIQFKVTRKDSDAADGISIVKLSPDIAEQAARLGLSLDKVLDLVKNGLREDVLKVGLLKLESRIAQKELRPIDSKMAYLKSVVLNADKIIEKTTILADEKATPSLPTTQITSTEQIRALNSAITTVLAEKKAILTTKEQIRAHIKVEFLALSSDEQKPFAADAFSAISAAGMLRPAVIRAFESSEWLKNYQLLSKMVEVYGIATRGAGWLDGPAQA